MNKKNNGGYPLNNLFKEIIVEDEAEITGNGNSVTDIHYN
jgi:hypothetical protein